MKLSVYDAKQFAKSFKEKSPIYFDVYQYLKTQIPRLDEQCLQLRADFFEDRIDLESYYDRICKMCHFKMTVAVAWWKSLSQRLSQKKSTQESKPVDYQERLSTMEELHELIAQMKYVYLDLQWPLLLHNAILNKVFFEELITERLSLITRKTGQDFLELLTMLDNSTENRYIVEKGKDVSVDMVQKRLGEFTDDFMNLVHAFSIQKKSERQFNQTFEYWSPMVIDVRDTIGCYLEKLGLCKKEYVDCMPIYELLPLLDEKFLPALYLGNYL